MASLNLNSTRQAPETETINSLGYVDLATTEDPKGAPSNKAIRDAVREKEAPAPLAETIVPSIETRHPLQRVSALNDSLDLESGIVGKADFETRLQHYGRVYGPGEPVRRAMELEIINHTDLGGPGSMYPNILGQQPGNIHRDILLNRESMVDWQDVYNDMDQTVELDFHTEMEKRMLSKGNNSFLL